MTRIKSLSRFVALLVLVTFIAAPMFAARGHADFTTFVALGDSFGAGVSSVGLNIKHQRYSWPAIIARQVGLNTDCNASNDGPKCFQIPYISEPGILPELELQSVSPLRIALKPGLGSPLNSGLQRPYNNMSVDGAEVGDLVNGLSGDGNEAINGAIVTRGLGTPVDQVLRLHPTFIAIWIGGDDAFNGVQAGDPSRMTSVADFTRDYNAMLDKLTTGAPNAGIVVGNLPTDVTKVPFVSTIPRFLIDASQKPVLDPTGKPIPLITDLGNGNFGPVPQGAFILLTAQTLIATGYGIPAPLKPLIPLPDVGKPLPASQVLLPEEVAAINQRLSDFNGVINSAASSRDIPVADIDGLLKTLTSPTGYRIGPFTFTGAYITGGVISLDGYHLTDIGYAIFANQYIRTINHAYGTHIPVASLKQFFQNNDPAIQADDLPTESLGVPEFSDDAAAALASNMRPAPPED